jgi:hypothetical protein
MKNKKKSLQESYNPKIELELSVDDVLNLLTATRYLVDNISQLIELENDKKTKNSLYDTKRDYQETLKAFLQVSFVTEDMIDYRNYR